MDQPSKASQVNADIRSTIEQLRERVIAGQRAAKRRGVNFGRPSVKVNTSEILALRGQGLSWREIARHLAIPKDTLRRSIHQPYLTTN